MNHWVFSGHDGVHIQRDDEKEFVITAVIVYKESLVVVAKNEEDAKRQFEADKYFLESRERISEKILSIKEVT